MSIDAEDTGNDISKKPANIIQPDIVTQLLDDCLSDEFVKEQVHFIGELEAFNAKIGQSFASFEKTITNYKNGLKKLEAKEFSITKPISDTRLEEKIRIFKSNMRIYKSSVHKQIGAIRKFSLSLYKEPYPESEKQRIVGMETYFDSLYTDATAVLNDWENFYTNTCKALKEWKKFYKEDT